MVTVIGYDKRLTEDGREFFTLTIQGGVEVVTSANGNLYMTARKTTIPSTFDEEGCKLILGQEIPGNISKVKCEPYEFINKETGESIMLTHTFEYVKQEMKTESSNVPEFVPFGLNDTMPIEAP